MIARASIASPSKTALNIAARVVVDRNPTNVQRPFGQDMVSGCVPDGAERMGTESSIRFRFCGQLGKISLSSEFSFGTISIAIPQ